VKQPHHFCTDYERRRAPAEGAAAPCPTCTDAGLALTRDGQLDECPTCTPKENAS
jgi:hypothetical protein